MEVFSYQGDSEDEELNQRVSELEDTLEKEVWDLRLGPAIWDRVRSQFPDDILTDENKVELQNYLFVEIIKLPAKKFLVFMKEVVSQSQNGKRLLDELMGNIYKTFNDEPIEDDVFMDDLDNLTDNENDDELKGFLNNLGIDLPDGYDDEDEDDGGEPVLR